MDTPPIRIVRDAVTRVKLAALAERQFGDMVKAVVDTGGQGARWIEFDSMINVRPAQGNRSRDVEDESLRSAIRGIVVRPVTAA